MRAQRADRLFRRDKTRLVHPMYPTYVTDNLPAERHVLLSPGRRTPVATSRSAERFSRETVVERCVRLHQWAISRTRPSCVRPPLHGTRTERGTSSTMQRTSSAISSRRRSSGAGWSLCSIHHRAFDQDLVGISPDYEVACLARTAAGRRRWPYARRAEAIPPSTNPSAFTTSAAAGIRSALYALRTLPRRRIGAR